VSAYAAAWWRRFGAEAASRPAVVGHRGVRGAAPENTMAAFEMAARAGVDAIELDVRLCRSGEVVVAHDPALDRVTSGADARLIADLSYGELRRVDVGGGERAPLLAEVLAFARARRLPVNVEIKYDVPDRPALVAAAARLLRTWDPAHPVLVSSFNPAMVAAFAPLAKGVPRALIVHRSRWTEVAFTLPRRLGMIAVHIERVLASPERVRALRAQGLLVSVWTVNDPREARDLAAIGATGIITDVPETILPALRARN
jgi:glycerophosphoryl diester phosphodiesterase